MTATIATGTEIRINNYLAGLRTATVVNYDPAAAWGMVYEIEWDNGSREAFSAATLATSFTAL